MKMPCNVTFKSQCLINVPMPAVSFASLFVDVRSISENMLDPCEEYDVETLSS